MRPPPHRIIGQLAIRNIISDTHAAGAACGIPNPKYPNPMNTLGHVSRLIRLLAVLVLCLCPAWLQAQKTYRVLILCKTSYNIPGYGAYTMTDAEINAARTAYRTTWPQMIRDHTGNQVAVRATFIVLPRTATSYWRNRVPSERPCLWPEDMPAADLNEYLGTFAKGWYDHVLNYNAISEFQYVNSGAYVTNASVSWSCLNRRSDLGYNQDALAGAWHEWLHDWELYYYNTNGHPNQNAAVHDPGLNGYNINSGGLPFWMGYYRDLTLGVIGGNRGFGPTAWNQYGTPRTRFSDTAPAIINNATYRIEARHSSRLLNVSGGDSNNGSPLIQWSFSGQGTTGNEQFKLVNAGSGYWYIRAVHSNKAIETFGGNTTNGTAIQQWTYHGGTNQQWQLIYRGSGNYSLKNRANGKFLTVTNNSLDLGAGASQQDGGTADHQQFRLIKI